MIEVVVAAAIIVLAFAIKECSIEVIVMIIFMFLF